MTANLRKKLTAMETFKQSRQSLSNTSGFSTENRTPTPSHVSDDNIGEIEKAITVSAEKLNYFFAKAGKDIGFVQRSFKDLQDIVNNIYDSFEDLLKE
jgi:phage-related protein